MTTPRHLKKQFSREIFPTKPILKSQRQKCCPLYLDSLHMTKQLLCRWCVFQNFSKASGPLYLSVGRWGNCSVLSHFWNFFTETNLWTVGRKAFFQGLGMTLCTIATALHLLGPNLHLLGPGWPGPAGLGLGPARLAWPWTFRLLMQTK